MQEFPIPVESEAKAVAALNGMPCFDGIYLKRGFHGTGSPGLESAFYSLGSFISLLGSVSAFFWFPKFRLNVRWAFREGLLGPFEFGISWVGSM